MMDLPGCRKTDFNKKIKEIEEIKGAPYDSLAHLLYIGKAI